MIYYITRDYKDPSVVCSEAYTYFCIVNTDVKPVRENPKEGLFGLLGYVKLGYIRRERFEEYLYPAMVWFSGFDKGPEHIRFEKGERYFPQIDKTYSEIKQHLEYNMDEFEPTDSEGYCMDGGVRYRGSLYGVYVSWYDDTTYTWEEAVIASLAEELAKSPYKVPQKEAIKKGYIFEVYKGDDPWAYEANVWHTLYYDLDDARLSRAKNAFYENELPNEFVYALHERNMRWIFASVAGKSHEKAYAEYKEIFKNNPVILELIEECAHASEETRKRIMGEDQEDEHE